MKTTFFLFTCIAMAVLQADSYSHAADIRSTYSFHDQRTPGQVDRVDVLLEVGGETNFVVKGKAKQEKLGVACGLSYLEKTLVVPNNGQGTLRGIRKYDKATASVKVGDDRFDPKLEKNHRTIVVEASDEDVLMFSPGGSLTREELDAIDIHFNTLLLDRLLPAGPVAVGHVWSPDKKLLANLLGLDEVNESAVEAKLTEVTKIVARFELNGRVEGRVHGADTEIDLKGRYRFDLRTKRIDWVGMLIKENRKASEIADGLDVVSRLQITVKPAKGISEFNDSALSRIGLDPSAEATLLTCELSGCRCKHGRRWFAEGGSGVLRMIDDGLPAAQCNIAVLPKRDPDQMVSLEEFQEDVREALGDNFGNFVAARQTVNGNGIRVLRVEAEGAVPGEKEGEKVPIRWIYYHLAARDGSQAAATFTIEKDRAEQFANADETIIGSLQFVE